MLLKLNKGTKEFVENREQILHPSKDERYTISYIEREAALLLQHLCACKKKDFGNMRMGKGIYGNSLIDKRILKRWGIN
jgi:hypothetical protein